jgi:long-chain acyl-CoA synthetase
MGENLANMLVETAERHGDRPVVRLGDTVVTYSALDEESARVAAFLRERGIGAGDRVGIMIANVPRFPVVYYGILRAGAVVVPMNVLLKGREVGFYLSDSGTRLLFAWHELAAAAEEGAAEAGAEVILVEPGGCEAVPAGVRPMPEVVERAAADTAVILYTSGTTGKPKGAELTHGNLRRNVEITANVLAGLGENDVLLGALPLFHSFGQTCSMNSAVCAGACLDMMPRFDAGSALEIIDRDGVTVFQGVPTMYHAILNHPERNRYDTSKLRLCMSGGAALPVEVLRGFEQTLGVVILEGYGLSETSPVASFNHPDRERKPGSIGTPIEGVEMKIVDEDGNEAAPGEVGEIVIRGHNVMKGYWKRPDATEDAMRGGWFHSGDLGRMDGEGYFFIVDRKKDMILRGGYNVYPREVEEVLYEHPAVLETAVVGVPDERMGEEVGAAIVLRPDAEADGDELRDFVKQRVAAYKYPRMIWFVEELPKGPTGKILKREIKVPDGLPRRPEPAARLSD